MRVRPHGRWRLRPHDQPKVVEYIVDPISNDPLGAAPPNTTRGDALFALGSGSDTEGNGSGGTLVPEVNGGITITDSPPDLGATSVVGDAGALAGRVTVRPVRTQTPPDIDGRLDDAAWQDAVRITEFVQREPQDGAPATEDTDVFIAYDSSNVYLAFHAMYQDAGIMRANR